jgi:hypothetical protein
MSYYNELYYKSYTGYLQTTLNADALARNSKEQVAAIENAGKAIVASNLASAAVLNRGMNELGYSMNAGFNYPGAGMLPLCPDKLRKRIL